jgi:ABC-type transport system substrate-binding protein
VAGAGVATDQYLPPAMPGFRDTRIYPLDRPDLATAKRLAGGRGGRAVLYTCNTAACTRRAEIVKSNLKAIRIELEIKQFPRTLAYDKASRRGEPFDIVDWDWAADYADPYSFLNNLLDGRGIKARLNNDVAYFNETTYNRKLEAAATMAGPKRYRIYGELDVELARDAAPLVAIANLTTRNFFSARMGCQLFQPVYGLDLAALCIKRASR